MALRVPVVGGPTVGQSAPFRDTRPVLQQADYSEARQLSTIGEGVRQAGNLGMAINQEGMRARQEAEAVLEADSMLELDGQLTSLSSEFTKNRGLAASEKRAEYIEKARKARQEVASRIASPEARQRFLVRSAQSVMGTSRSIEAHTGKEFETARDGTVKAREAQAVGRAESGVLDPRDFSAIEGDVIRSIRETQHSAAEGDERIADFQSRMMTAAITGLVAQGRADEAKKLLEEAKPRIGARYVETKVLVDRATAGQEKDRLIAEGAKLVAGTYASLRQEGNEYVTEEQMRAAVNLDETGDDVRAEVGHALEKQIREEDARKRADIARERDNANRADVDRKPIPGATLEFLRKHDPDFLLAREARLRAEARAWKAARGSDKSAKAAEAAAQKAVDAEFLLRLQTELVNDPATKPDEFLTAFIAEKAKEGDDVTVSDVARAKAGLESAKAGKKVDNGELSAERNAAQRFEATIKAATPKVKGKPLDGAKLNERVGKALQLYRQRTEAKGKPLDEAELAGIEAEVVRETVVETPREVFGIPLGTSKKKAMGVDLLDPAAPDESAGPEEKTVGGKAYVKRNGKWVLK